MIPVALLPASHVMSSPEAIVGPILANYNLIQNGGRRFNTTDLDTGGQRVWFVTQPEGGGCGLTQGFTGPDGTATAVKMNEVGLGTPFEHYIYSAGGGAGSYSVGFVPATIGLQFRFTLVAKAAERTRVVLRFIGGDGSTFCDANFDLVGGNTGFDNQSAVVPLPTSSMMSIGGGWWICRLDGAVLGPANGNIGWRIVTDAGSGTAARNTNYTGDGTSGILIWFANVLPRFAGALTNVVFFDDFDTLSTIDVNDTGALGFNWYPHNTWPAGPGSNFPAAITSPANTFSVSNSVLTIAKGANSASGLNLDLSTARVKPGNNNDFIGRVFTAPFLIEARTSWDVTLATAFRNYVGPFGHTTGFNTGSNGQPSFWTVDIDGLINAPLTVAGYSTNPRAGEIDFGEFYSGGFAMPAITFGGGIIDYHFLVSTDTSNGSLWGNQPASITDFHRQACMVLPATSPTAQGVQIEFFDGIWTRATITQIAPVGTGAPFSDFNVFRFPIQFSAASGFMEPGHTPQNAALYVDWVKVNQ